MPRKSVSLHHVSKSPNGGKKRAAFWRSLELNSPVDSWKRLLLLLTITIQNFCILNWMTEWSNLEKGSLLVMLSYVPQKTIIGCDCWLMLSALETTCYMTWCWRNEELMLQAHFLLSVTPQSIGFHVWEEARRSLTNWVRKTPLSFSYNVKVVWYRQAVKKK